MPLLRTAPVAANDEVGPAAFLLLCVAGNFPTSPGQFYLLRVWDRDPLLSRPVSVFDRDAHQIRFLIFSRGVGTQRLAELSPGYPLIPFGPLGTPLRPRGRRMALIGGGSGIAALYFAAKEFRAQGEVDVFPGFWREPLLPARFAEVASGVCATSETGEGGRGG